MLGTAIRGLVPTEPNNRIARIVPGEQTGQHGVFTLGRKELSWDCEEPGEVLSPIQPPCKQNTWLKHTSRKKKNCLSVKIFLLT